MSLGIELSGVSRGISNLFAGVNKQIRGIDKQIRNASTDPTNLEKDIGSTEGQKPLALMENILGLLRINVKRGINLAVRDVRSSDPYVVVRMGKQKLKTRVIKKSVNPYWNEDLTLSVTDPNLPVKLTVYDRDLLSKDDKMGEAEFDIKPLIETLKMNLAGLASGTLITRVKPSRQNCLSDDSCIFYSDGSVVQDLYVRLQNVECGELEIRLQWIDLPSSSSLY
ncbi:unnamed protein product [Dovyalis caffra]|uniref:C2 domain-containing protein n=1 Tax=Dovyalis caffra TaxID=77055 RepID=A0AAV1SDU9_9ROSI|nr:unnamed protein product [Dovyalis caffra]